MPLIFLVSLILTCNVGREEAYDRHGDGQEQKGLAHHVGDDSYEAVNGCDFGADVMPESDFARFLKANLIEGEQGKTAVRSSSGKVL